MKPVEEKRHNQGYFLLQLMTLGRIPIAILFLVVLIYGQETTFTLALNLLLLLIIEFTDLYDGKIARRFELVSESGATLDPFADSVSRLIVYWALATNGLVILYVPLIMALRDITVAYSRIVLAQNNRTVSAKKSGKLKATVQAIGSFLALLGPYYWEYIGSWSFYALSWIIITATFLSAIEYVKDAISSSKRTN
ncbi:MAG: CDP-alcohol phosphatidyltransferase family protein [Candidatus Aminicenantes bacterium]|nr:MAG: CDP-alcohol phosphatidyltransferase family protein [Candidatus Aminicenantes bacterium]